MSGTEERLAREQAFHDARFTDDARPADRFYAINAASRAYAQRAIETITPGGRMLDYGCGAGAHAALHAAGMGHDVTAIDLSPVAIEQARRAAERQGVADRIDFRVANAESLGLEAASFDLVCGLGVIHHLALGPALREVARVTKPRGAAVFVEPLGHNPLINLYRSRTPEQRTEDEHPLKMQDFAILGESFAAVDVDYFHLLGLLALPFTRNRRLPAILACLDALDRVVLRTPARRWAWMAGIRLTAPRAG